MSKNNRVYACPWCGYDPESWFVNVLGFKPAPEDIPCEFVEPPVITGINVNGKRMRICSNCRGPRPFRCELPHEFDKPCSKCGRLKFKKMKRNKPDKQKRKRKTRPKRERAGVKG